MSESITGFEQDRALEFPLRIRPSKLSYVIDRSQRDMRLGQGIVQLQRALDCGLRLRSSFLGGDVGVGCAPVSIRNSRPGQGKTRIDFSGAVEMVQSLGETLLRLSKPSLATEEVFLQRGRVHRPRAVQSRGL